MSTLDVYVKADDKIKLLQKARKMGISVSQLLVLGGLSYSRSEATNATNDSSMEGNHD
jgi:hypothetical protein